MHGWKQILAELLVGGGFQRSASNIPHIDWKGRNGEGFSLPYPNRPGELFRRNHTISLS